MESFKLYVYTWIIQDLNEGQSSDEIQVVAHTLDEARLEVINIINKIFEHYLTSENQSSIYHYNNAFKKRNCIHHDFLESGTYLHDFSKMEIKEYVLTTVPLIKKFNKICLGKSIY
jgi:hypothetical protein